VHPQEPLEALAGPLTTLAISHLQTSLLPFFRLQVDAVCLSAPSAAGAPDALARATQVTLMCEKLSTIIAPLLPSASSGANPASSLTAALQIAQQATPTSAFDPKVPPPPPSPFTAFSQLVKLLQDYVSLHQSQRKVTHPVESERGASTPQEQAARSVALNKVRAALSRF